MSLFQTLLRLVHQLNAHQVSNPDDHLYLTDPEFLSLTDRWTVDLIDAIVEATRSLLGNGDGTINRRALTAA